MNKTCSEYKIEMTVECFKNWVAKVYKKFVEIK
jgi:hypothetical protein